MKHHRWKYTCWVRVPYRSPVLSHVPSSAILDASQSDDVVYLNRRRFKRACRRMGVRL